MRCTEPPAPVSRRRSRSSPPASWPTRRFRPPPLTPPPLLPGEPSKSRSDWFRELQVHPRYSDPTLLIPPNVLTAIRQRWLAVQDHTHSHWLNALLWLTETPPTAPPLLSIGRCADLFFSWSVCVERLCVLNSLKSHFICSHHCWVFVLVKQQEVMSSNVLLWDPRKIEWLCPHRSVLPIISA